MGEYAHTSIQLSHLPNITSFSSHTDCVKNPMGYHMYFIPQPPSSYSHYSLDCIVLCSSILDSTIAVNEDQAIDGVAIAQPTCTAIHEEYDWEIRHQPSAKDELLLSKHPPLFPNIPRDFDIPRNSTIPNLTCVSLSVDAHIVDHLHNTPYVSPSSDNVEEKSFIEDPPCFPFSFSRNTQCEHSFFSSTPLSDSSNHGHADKHLEFCDLGYRDHSTSSFDHDVDSMIINLCNGL